MRSAGVSIRWIRGICTPLIAPTNYDATKYRHWVQLAPPAPGANSISVMTYNLLSRHYMWKQVFGYLNQEYLDWTNYRFPLLNKTIAQLNCDIMCFQEMEYFMYENHWRSQFPSTDYTSVFVKKSVPKYWDNAPTDFVDGVGVFINTKRFDVVDQLLVHFGQYILDNRRQFDVTDDLLRRVVPRNTVAVLLKLYDKIANKTVYVTNTHLYWSPKFNDVKVLQTKILLNLLESFITDKDPNVLVLGDFNSNPGSTVVQLLALSQVNRAECPEFEGFDYGINNNLIDQNNTITNPFHLTNIYQHLIDQQKLQFTTYTRSLTGVVDHIFVDRRHFQPQRILSAVDNDYCVNQKIQGFPNEQFPSDHIPLVAELAYK